MKNIIKLELNWKVKPDKDKNKRDIIRRKSVGNVIC